MSLKAGPPRDVRPGDKLVVVHNFDARGLDELTLRRGDRIELVELDDGFGDGWYLGRHIGENKAGLFPGVYTTSSSNFTAKEASLLAPGILPRDESGHSRPSARQTNSDIISPISSDEATPQASRHTSTTGADLASEHEQNLQIDTTKKVPVTPTSVSANSTPLSPTVQRTISQTLNNTANGEESPVMNETLSVIDEHITNFATPRHSIIVQENHDVNDSSSEYSTSKYSASHLGHRYSYVQGTETDDEEDAVPTEPEIRKWDHHRMAQYLRGLGVDPNHCDIFEAQEITGDVLLDMDQEFIFMKEFDFGVMGRRLKTWHGIRALQEQIVGPGRPGMSRMSNYDDINRPQSRTVASGSTSDKQRHNSQMSRDTDLSNYRGLSLSSMVNGKTSNGITCYPFTDTNPTSSLDDVRESPALKPESSLAHKQKESLDRNWTMAAGLQDSPEDKPAALFKDRIDAVRFDESSDPIRPGNIDRGYNSGVEDVQAAARRSSKKAGSKRRSHSHARYPSNPTDGQRSRRHSGFGGSMSSIRDFTFSTFTSKSSPSDSRKPNSKNAALTPLKVVADDSDHSPTVTKLEPSSNSPSRFLSFIPAYSRNNNERSGRSSPLPSTTLKSVAPKIRRTIGLRTISDAVTGNERSRAAMSQTSSSPAKSSPRSPTGTSSSTPSATTKSVEIDSPISSKGLDSLSVTSKQKPHNVRTKSKRDTSAYKRGLLKMTPQEQMADADYYGWMRKKSSNLMTTWKSRLFILKGRRLSYYYSIDDTEERGLIDISSHRVFRADSDTITSLHATLTGAKSPIPTSPSSNVVSPSSLNSELSKADLPSPSTPFIFKLVPPKAGLSRAVQFTKPAVHFFQVDSIEQGRLWMAAFMKATIERDLNLPIRTTNKQKTITLKQARLRNERMLMQRDEIVTGRSAKSTDDDETADTENFEKIGDLDAGLLDQVTSLSTPDRLQSL